MTVYQLASVGDSLSEGTEYSGGFSVAQGGKGAWWELVAEQLSNIIGPRISSGFRGVYIPGAGVTGASEWTFTTITGDTSTGWKAVASTDAFDKLPYGFGWRSAAGTGAVATWTKPTRWRSLHGVAVYFVDFAAGDIWSYSTDGGSNWTNISVSLSNNNTLAKFYVTGDIASIKIRAANAAGTAKPCYPAGIEAFFVAPSTGTGFIWHNLASNGQQLHDLVLSTSGDRLAWFDAVVAKDATVITNQPNLGVLLMHGRDVSARNSTSDWNTDLGTFWTRTHTHGTPLWMNHFELADPSEPNASVAGGETGYVWANQTAYRDQLKTTAAAKSPAVTVLDLYDRYSKMGYGVASGTTVTLTNSQNVAIRAAGLVNPLDNGHLTAAGHLDLVQPIYWFLRNNLLSVGNLGSTYTAKAKAAAVQYKGKQAAVQYTATAPLSVA